MNAIELNTFAFCVNGIELNTIHTKSKRVTAIHKDTKKFLGSGMLDTASATRNFFVPIHKDKKFLGLGMLVKTARSQKLLRM